LALLVLRCVANTGRSTGQRVDPQPTHSRLSSCHLQFPECRDSWRSD